jgi:predicted Zn-dependent protease
MRKARFALIFSLLAASSSMAVAPVAAQRSAQGAPRGISQSDMRQGAQAHPQLLEEYGGSYGGPQDAYVTQVGQRIAVQSGLSNATRDFRITLLNSPVNNAFAIPGGYVYVTRQLVALMNDEAELAAVLGHEVGHVAARHSTQRNRTSTISSGLAVLLGVLTGNSTLGQIASQGAQLYTLRFSRQQEYESDDLGIRYLASGGYDPTAMGTVLASLAAQNNLDAQLAGRDARSQPEFASTHPDPGSRVQRALQRARATPARGMERNRDGFLAAIDGMLYGDDPRQGIVDGRTFRHPVLRLAFDIPQGFTMSNGTRAVSVSGQGGQAQFTGGAFGGDLGDYVRRVFAGLSGQGGQLPAVDIRGTRINGLEAAYATTRANTQQGAVDVTVVAYAFDRDTAYHWVVIAPAGRGAGPFGPMIDSVRRLSPQEAAQVRAREIDVVTVRPGDTPARLAQQMAYPDAQLERFLVLNGLARNQPLQPGQKVKLIVYRR